MSGLQNSLLRPPRCVAGTRLLPLEAVPDEVRAALATPSAGRELGGTAYCYDIGAAVERAQTLRQALPEWCEVFYAAKANSFPPLVQALAAAVEGFEVASQHEVELCAMAAAKAGKPPRLVASGPGKSESTLACLADHHREVVVNVESVLELHRLAHLAEAGGRTVQVALRVNPSSVRIGGSLRMGGAPTPFGIPEAEVPAALAVAARLRALDVVGFHFHAVCNNLDAGAHADYVAWCTDWSTRTARAHGVELRGVDAGGGLGVAFDGARPFDLGLFARRLRTEPPPAGVRVLFEPGRWLVTDCGYYAAEVTDLKFSYGTWFAVIRGGINHFLLPSSWDIVHRFAVVPTERWPGAHPRPEARDVPVTVVGELCTPEDVLARDVQVERIRAGDHIVFPQAGSYGWEFAMHQFLGHPPARRVALGAGY
jgi:diaminopimelate decarboxylase